MMVAGHFSALVAAQMGRCDHQTGSRNPNGYFGEKKSTMHQERPSLGNCTVKWCQ